MKHSLLTREVVPNDNPVTLLLDYATKLYVLGTTPIIILTPGKPDVTIKVVWKNPAWETAYENTIVLLRQCQTPNAQNHLVQPEPLGNKITKIGGISSQQE